MLRRIDIVMRYSLVILLHHTFQSNIKAKKHYTYSNALLERRIRELEEKRILDQMDKLFSTIKTHKIYSFYYAGILLGISMVFLHFPLIPLDDDPTFMAIARDENLFQWLALRYSVWTSRLIIESVLWLVAKNFLVWKLLNISLIMILYFFLCKLLIIDKQDGKNYWIIAFGILIYPFIHMGSAGYMATTINSLWPVVFAVIACYGMKKAISHKRIRIWEYPVYFCSLLYASNAEAMNAFLFGLTAYLFIRYIVEHKKLNYYLVAQLLIVVSMLIFILTCPGNANRSNVQTTLMYPQFVDYGFFTMFLNGYISTLAHFIARPNIVFPIFCVLLYSNIHFMYDRKLYRIIALTPFIIFVLSLFANIIVSYDSRILVWGFSLLNIFSGVVLITTENYTNVYAYIPIVVYSICLSAVLISIYLCFMKNKQNALFFVYLFLLGFGTRVIIGFTPTLWFSAFRTFIIFYFVLIYFIILFYQKLMEFEFKHKNIIFYCFAFSGIVSVAASFLLNHFIGNKY